MEFWVSVVQGSGSMAGMVACMHCSSEGGEENKTCSTLDNAPVRGCLKPCDKQDSHRDWDQCTLPAGFLPRPH